MNFLIIMFISNLSHPYLCGRLFVFPSTFYDGYEGRFCHSLLILKGAVEGLNKNRSFVIKILTKGPIISHKGG